MPFGITQYLFILSLVLIYPTVDSSTISRNPIALESINSSTDPGFYLLHVADKNEKEKGYEIQKYFTTQDKTALVLRYAHLNFSEENTNVSNVKSELSSKKHAKLNRKRRAAKKSTPKPKKQPSKNKQKCSKTSKSKQKASKTAKTKPKSSKSAKKPKNNSQNKAPKKTTQKKSPPRTKTKQSTSKSKQSNKSKNSKPKVKNTNKPTKKNQPKTLKSKLPTPKLTTKAVPDRTTVGLNYSTSKNIPHNIGKMNFFNALTANDAALEDCHFHIFHGNFKLNLDVDISDFSGINFQTMPESERGKCIFKTWGKAEVNILFLDIQFMDQQTDSVSRKRQEFPEDKLNRYMKDNTRSGKQVYRFERSLLEELKNIEVRRVNRQKISSRMPAGKYQNSIASENHKSPLISPKSEDLTYRVISKPAEYERLLKFKLPKEHLKADREEEQFKPILNDQQYEPIDYRKPKWVVRKKINKGDTFEAYYRMSDIGENISENKKQRQKFQTQQPTENDQSASINPRIALTSFSPLIDYVNKYLLKIEGSHMLLLSRKMNAFLSAETNLKEFLIRLAEKSSKSPIFLVNRKGKNRGAVMDNGLFKIILAHFVSTGSSILKNTSSDVLQLKFKVTPEIKSMASQTSDKFYFLQQVAENCLSIPLKRELSFQMTFSVKQLPKNRLIPTQMQLRNISLNTLSEINTDDLKGKFVLQIKKTCNADELFPQSAKKRIKGTNFPYQSNSSHGIKSTMSPTSSTELHMTTTSPTTPHIALLPQTTDESEAVFLGQSTIGFDYWIPETLLEPDKLIQREELYRPKDMFVNVLSILFPNISMPPDLLESLQPNEVTSASDQLSENDNQSLKQESNSEKYRSKIQNLQGLFKLKQKGKLSNNEGLSDAINYGHEHGTDAYYEYQDEDKDGKDKSVKEEGSAKQAKNQLPFNPRHKLAPSNPETFEDSDAFIEPPIDIVYSKSERKPASHKQEKFKDSDDVEDFHGLFKLKAKQKTASDKELSNQSNKVLPVNKLETNDYAIDILLTEESIKSEPLLNNSKQTFGEQSVGMDKSIAKKEKPFRDSGDVHAVFKLKSKDITPDSGNNFVTETSHLQNIQDNEYDFVEEDMLEQLKMCEFLMSEFHENFHGQFQLKPRFESEKPNFHGMFRLKTRQGNDEAKTDTDSTQQLKHKVNEPFINKGNFHGMFQLKPKVEHPGSTGEQNNSSMNKMRDMDNFHGMFRLKAKEDNFENGRAQNISLMSKLRDKDSFHRMFRLKTKEERPGNSEEQNMSSMHKMHDMDNFHGMFRFKTKEQNSYSGGSESISPKNKLGDKDSFHGMFRLKTKEHSVNDKDKGMNQFPFPQRSIKDRLQAVFRLKSRNEKVNLEDNLPEIENLINWCKNRYFKELN